MGEANRIVEDRRRKLEALRALGVDPFPARFPDRTAIARARETVGRGEESELGVAGRIVALRSHGKTVFADLRDGTGRIQAYLRRDAVAEEDWPVVGLLDLGDVVGVTGTTGTTRTGEPTIFVRRARVLAKSLFPPPEKWHGLTDPELRVRRRYVDLFASEESRATFERRSRLVRGLRRALEDRGFLEVETPILHPIAGGAAARPFRTHHNALDLDLYLRIAPELYLKRLLVGGFERVFEIGRVFRNEGVSTRHNPEFTMLEVYEAFSDGGRMMALTEELLVETARSCGVEGDVPLPGGGTASLETPFPRAEWGDLLRDAGGGDVHDADDLRRRARQHGIAAEPAVPIGHVADALFKKLVEPDLQGPIFVTGHPALLSPLAKADARNPSRAERFELYLAGTEIANGFSELNDPDEQERRFREQLAQRDPEGPSAFDRDYVEALSYGMPPAGGMGLGVDRLAILLCGRESIREVILFPLVRPLDDPALADAVTRAPDEAD